jgi:F-type H+-transporting ATPase subunit b
VLIDWFTVAAQVVNFLVLVYLLKRFLYGPIIRAMDERERKIAARLEEAGKKREEAEQEAEAYRQKNQAFDAKRQEMLSQAKEEAEAARKELTKVARNQVEAVQANWYEAIQREKEAFLEDLRQRAGKHIYTIARRMLEELANADLEEQIIRVFIERLGRLDEGEQTALRESIGDSGTTSVEIQSAFDIPTEMRQKIEEAVRIQISERAETSFEISSDSICGIELMVHGRKIAWSLENYLVTLEEGLVEALEGGTKGVIADESPEKRVEPSPKQGGEIQRESTDGTA